MTAHWQSPSEPEEPEDALAAARAAVIQVLTTTSEHREQILDAARRERERILASAHAEAKEILDKARGEAGHLREEAVSIVSEARSMLPELAALDSRLGYLIDRLGMTIDQPTLAAPDGSGLDESSVQQDNDSESRDEVDPQPEADAQPTKRELSPEEFESFLNQLAEHLEHLDRARSTGDRHEVGRVLHDLSDLAAKSDADELADLARHLGPDARPDQLDDLINRCYQIRQSLGRSTSHLYSGGMNR